MSKSTAADKRNKFWGNLDDWSSEFAAAVIERHVKHVETLKRTKKHARIQRAWQAVYSRDKNGACDTTEISVAGRKGETILMRSNRFGRLIRDHVTMVQQTKSLPEPIAVNADADCQDQVTLAKGIIEHYKREFDLEGVKAERAMVAEICSDSYLHVPWNPDAGNEVLVEDIESPAEDMAEPGEEPADAGERAGMSAIGVRSEPANDNGSEEPSEQPKQRIVYEGDFEFAVHTPYDVAQDRTSPRRKQPGWTIVRAPVNKFDLLAQVREEVTDPTRLAQLEHAILNAPRWTDELKDLGYDDEENEHDDSIPMFFVYIPKCRARAQGRYAKVIDKKTVFFDSPMVEPRIPVFRLSQGEVLFRNESTTPNHDGLGLQEALDAQFSTIISNNANYGMTRVIAPKESELNQTLLDAGAAIVEYKHKDLQGDPLPAPMPWSALDSNPELKNTFGLITSEMDTVMGGSPALRGDHDSTKTESGSHFAAVFAAAQNVGTGAVADVIRSEEELYTFLVDSLKVHATTERVISIVGEHNTFSARRYKADSIKKIVRVAVQQADAMRDTLQGRLAMVEMLKGLSPEQQQQAIAITKTGRVESVTDPFEAPRLLLERENEDLRNLEIEPPVVMPNDPHADHWKSHMNQLNDPDIRRNVPLSQRIITHAKQHVSYLTPGSPVFDADALHLTGQNPLPPLAPPGAPPAESSGPNAGPAGPETPPGSAAVPPGKGSSHAPMATAGGPQAPRLPTSPTNGQQMATGGGTPGRPAASPAPGVGG